MTLDSNQVTQHISRKFNEELETIRQRVLAMGGLVEEQVVAAVAALVNGDAESAKNVVARDSLVDDMEVQIDEQCTRVLAKRQPAAGDLRLIVAALKTITDLERMGDESEKIARMALRISANNESSRSFKPVYGAIAHFGEHVHTILGKALDAYARMDPDAAMAVAREERKSDAEYEAIARQILTYMFEDPRHISPGLDVMWSARALERIGDHARNVCEYVVYMVQGRDVRHAPDDEQT